MNVSEKIWMSSSTNILQKYLHVEIDRGNSFFTVLLGRCTLGILGGCPLIARVGEECGLEVHSIPCLPAVNKDV